MGPWITKVEIETLGMDQQARFPMFEYCSELFCKSLPFRVWLVIIYHSCQQRRTKERNVCGIAGAATEAQPAPQPGWMKNTFQADLG